MIFERVRQCMIQAIKLDAAAAATITDRTMAADLPKWDSAAHLALIFELETAFGITFDNNEIASLGSVPAILARLAEKGVGANAV